MWHYPRVHKALRGSFSPALVVLLLFWPLAAVARGETRHILLLSSAERPFAPQSGFADALVRDLIRSSREPIQFVEVSVQPARASDETPDVSTAQRIQSTFAAHTPDLVITIGGPAATFAQRFRRELFPAVPMLIAGVDYRFVEGGTFTDNETTVATQHEPAMMIDEILRLLPETRSVMVIVGTSPVERFWLQQMKTEFRRFGDRLQFSWTNELSFDAIKERSRTMPARSAIFFALLSVDGKGEPRVDGDTLKQLHAVANAPMFALFGMGEGIVGGPMMSISELSRTTTQVALRVLAGESPGRIKTPVQRRGQPTYDARELRRWNVDERRLLPGRVVLFREPTMWERNRGPIALGALLGGIPLLVIVLFVVMKQRRAEGRSSDADAVLTPQPADATVRMWTAGRDGRRVEAGQAPGAGPHGSWMARMHPDDVERCSEMFRRALENREPFQMQYRIREAGGAEKWVLDTGLVKFSGDGFDGYVGSTVDITRIERARVDLSNLSQHLLQSHERESAALARTLHEDVCQRMVALTLRLHSLKAPDAVVADVHDTLSSLVDEIAAASDPVHKRLELLGLATLGRRLCQDLSKRHDVVIHFQDEGVPPDLPFDIALALFRVLQEAAVNAAVHSQAREIWVSVLGAAAEVRLRVVDRGVGFDAQRPVPGAGVGLVAIRERLKLVNGDSVISSTPGEGTRVEAWVPLR